MKFLSVFKLSCKWLLEDLVKYTRDQQDLPGEPRFLDDTEKAIAELTVYGEYEEKNSDRQKKTKSWMTNRNRRRMAGKSLGCLDQFNPVRIFFHELIWHRVSVLF